MNDLQTVVRRVLREMYAEAPNRFQDLEWLTEFARRVMEAMK